VNSAVYRSQETTALCSDKDRRVEEQKERRQTGKDKGPKPSKP
jgi:hypothetical protein